MSAAAPIRVDTDKPARCRRRIPLSARIVGILCLIGASIAIWFGARGYRQQSVIGEIMRVGGRINMEGEPPDWLPSNLGKQYANLFDPVKFVSFKNANATDATLACLKKLPRLNAVHVAGSGVTDAGLAEVGRLTNLTWLVLEGPQFTDRSLDALVDLPRLQVLGLHGTAVTDAGVTRLASLTHIQWLDLTGTQLTDAGIADVVRHSKLRVLKLGETQITDAGVRRLKALTKLELLDLHGTEVTDLGAAELAGIASLKSIDLQGTQVSDEAVSALQATLPAARIEK